MHACIHVAAIAMVHDGCHCHMSCMVCPGHLKSLATPLPVAAMKYILAATEVLVVTESSSTELATVSHQGQSQSQRQFL